MILFSQEVKNMNELNILLNNENNVIKPYEIAVIAYIFDKENKILFQRRGIGCRDERLKLETIGGKVKQTDADFRSALEREIREEAVKEANIEIEEFVVATYAQTFDMIKNKKQSWIYLTYKGSFTDGNLKVMEPSKNLGYERYKIDEVNTKELSNGAKEIFSIVSQKYSSFK